MLWRIYKLSFFFFFEVFRNPKFQMSRQQDIEGIDGGLVQYNAAEEDEMDALNADTFGEDALDGIDVSSSGFFDFPTSQPKRNCRPRRRCWP